MYSTQQNQVFKAVYNQMQTGGKRIPRQEEPELPAAHQDFLLAEMQDMAIDFMEEGRGKRLMALRLAKEA